MTLLETLSLRQRVVTPDFRDTRALEAAVESVKQAFPDYERSRGLTVEEIIEKLSANISSWQWSNVKVGDLAVAMKAVFSGNAVAESVVSDFLAREAECTTNVSLLAPACDAYLDGWERSSDRTRWLAELLRRRIDDLPVAWKRCFTNLPEFLDFDDAPRLLAAKMSAERDPYAWLVASGIVAPHSGRLMHELHAAWLEALPEPKTSAQVDQVFSWMFPASGHPLDGERAAECLEKLLRPWVAAQPPSDLRAKLLDRVVEAFGDPRNQRADFWAHVAEPCRRVVVRWLAGASMDALLAIITKSTSNHMWPPRHSFWKGLYDRGLIDEAWVALSPRAFNGAKTMFAETGNEIYRMVSLQSAKSRRDTCLLIMRIGRYTVLEGSHDYRVHVFQHTDPLAPRLYEDEYDAESLILPQHHGDTRTHDAHYGWTRWVERRILR
jgi:hypothetical protein